jgi:hypothetical protein
MGLGVRHQLNFFDELRIQLMAHIQDFPCLGRMLFGPIFKKLFLLYRSSGNASISLL